jgi:hypothetical protein
MSRKSGLARAIWTSGAVLLALSGCSQMSGDDSTAWARGALERNPNLEVVAHDADTGAFTVRDKASGELIVLRADEIIGTVPSAIAAATKPAATSSPAPATAEPAAPAASEPDEETPTGTMARSGEAARAEDVDEPTGPGPQQSSAAFDAATANQPVLAQGPGYSIKRGSGANAPAAPAASAGNATAARGVRMEQRYDPIICQGQRMIQIDNQNLAFEGDAITAEAGCEIHITNSHITAGGIGVLARGASVHIKNSSIEGDSGSVSASDGAQVYAQSSTFKGLSRRLDTAALHDLGGNVWN